LTEYVQVDKELLKEFLREIGKLRLTNEQITACLERSSETK